MDRPPLIVSAVRPLPSGRTSASLVTSSSVVARNDRSINDIGGGVKIIDVQTDHSTGQLKHTGNELDLAINGKGFFHIRGEDGEQYLSRAGNFAVDTQGRLITQNGHRPVLDQSGSEAPTWMVSPRESALATSVRTMCRPLTVK